jgi:hypothetical protein
MKISIVHTIIKIIIATNIIFIEKEIFTQFRSKIMIKRIKKINYGILFKKKEKTEFIFNNNYPFQFKYKCLLC